MNNQGSKQKNGYIPESKNSVDIHKTINLPSTNKTAEAYSNHTVDTKRQNNNASQKDIIRGTASLPKCP